MEIHACRAQLARLLADESTLLGQLARQLQDEHQFLAGNDVDALERAGAARQQTVAQLLRLEDERRGLCAQYARGGGGADFASLLRWCDPQGTLAAAQMQCSRQAGECRTQNERNGALVTARLNRVSGMLDLLTEAPAARTYQPRATRYAAPPAGRMVSTSA